MKKQALLILVSCSVIAGCSGTRPDLGVKSGQLLPCPSSPNCVNSQNSDESQSIQPIAYSSSRQEAQARLGKVLDSEKRTTIVERRDDYIHATFTSALFRFVDDVEFFFPAGEKVIHVRSASRIGYSDLGVNRKRIERIRSLFTAQE